MVLNRESSGQHPVHPAILSQNQGRFQPVPGGRIPSSEMRFDSP